MPAYRCIVAMLLLTSGCYGELTAGAYRVIEGHEAGDSAWSVGANLGVYIEPDPVHVAVAYGGDLVVLDHEGYGPPALQLHQLVGLAARLELKVLSFEQTGRHALWITSGFTWTQSDELITIDFEDNAATDMTHAAWGWSGFLGAAAKFWFGLYGMRVSLGPAFMESRSDTFSNMRALGVQFRYAFFGYPDLNNTGNLGALFTHGYDADAEAERFQRDQQRYHQGLDRTRDTNNFSSCPPGRWDASSNSCR